SHRRLLRQPARATDGAAAAGRVREVANFGIAHHSDPVFGVRLLQWMLALVVAMPGPLGDMKRLHALAHLDRQELDLLEHDAGCGLARIGALAFHISESNGIAVLLARTRALMAARLAAFAEGCDHFLQILLRIDMGASKLLERDHVAPVRD